MDFYIKLKAISIFLIVLLSLIVVTIHISNAVNEPLIQSLKSIQKTKFFNTYGFNNKILISSINWTTLFYVNGTVLTTDGATNFIIDISNPISSVIIVPTLWFNSTFVANNYLAGSTSFWIYYNFTDNSPKIKQTLVGTVSQSYNITINFPNSAVSINKVSLKSLSYDWSDVKSTVFTTSNTVKYAISGAFVIDPAVTITTKISSSATYYSTQRKLFAVTQSGTVYQYAFFGNSSGIFHTTSTDSGVTWSNPTLDNSTIIAGGGAFSVRYRQYSGTDYVYMAYSTNNLAAGAEIDFIRGSISGTTITWGTEYVVQAPDTSRKMGNPDVECTTDGRIIVAFSYAQAVPSYVLAMRAETDPNNDGSSFWTNVLTQNQGFTGLTNEEYVALTILSGTNGTTKAYCAWQPDSTQLLKGCLWNGTQGGWGAVETISSTVYQPEFSLDSYTNTVDIMFINSSLGTPDMRIRQLNTPFWSTETKASTDFVGSVSLCVNQTTGDIWASWVGNIFKYIDYVEYTGTWGTTNTLYNVTAGNSIDPASLNSYYDAVNNTVGVMWTESGGITTYLKYIGLNIVSVTSINYIISLSFSITSGYNQSPKWSSIIKDSFSVTTSWNIKSKWSSVIRDSFGIISSWNIISKWKSIIKPSFSITTSWNEVSHMIWIVSLSLNIHTVWNVLTKWSSNVGLSLSISTTWNIFSHWYSNVNPSFFINTTLNILFPTSISWFELLITTKPYVIPIVFVVVIGFVFLIFEEEEKRRKKV